MRRGIACGLLALAMVATAASAANAAALCQKKKGQLLVRAACRKHERPVGGTTFGVPGPKGQTGAPGAAGDPAQFPVRLVDTNGVEVGKIIDLHPGTALVEVRAASVPTPLTMFVGASGFPSDSLPLLYESADCSGIAYMRNTFRPDGFAPDAVVWGLAAYYATGPPRAITYASGEYAVDPSPCPNGYTPTGRGTCCYASSATDSGYVPTARVPLSAFGLVPPFRAVVR